MLLPTRYGVGGGRTFMDRMREVIYRCMWREEEANIISHIWRKKKKHNIYERMMRKGSDVRE